MKKSQQKPYLSGAIFIGIITFVGYIAAFLFESGYLDYFSIPNHFVEISILNVVLATITISGILLGVIHVFNLISLFVNDGNKFTETKYRTIFLLGFATIFGFKLILTDPTQTEIVVYFGALLFIVIFYFIWPYLVYRDKGGLEDRLVADQNYEQPIQDRSLIQNLFNTLHKKDVFIIAISLLFLIFSKDAGYNIASKQKEYAILQNNTTGQNLAVVRVYTDKLILVELNKENDKIGYNFYIKKLEDIDRPFIVKKIGPLK